MTRFFDKTRDEHAALAASIARNTKYREDAASSAAIATQTVIASQAAMTGLATVPQPLYPNNPAHGHGALTKVTKTETRVLDYALLAFSVVGIFDGLDNVEYYWSNADLSNAERTVGVVLGLGQVALGVMMLTGALAMLGLITLSGGGAAMASVVALCMLAYAAVSAARYFVEMGRSIYLAVYDAKNRTKHVWNAIKYFAAAVLNLCLLAQIASFFIPILKGGKALKLHPSLQGLFKFGSKFTNYWQKFIVGVLIASVVNFVWKTAENTADEINSFADDFAEMKRKWNDPTVSGWAKTKAVLKVIYKAIKIFIKTLLTGGLSIYAAWAKRRKATKKAASVSQSPTSTTSSAGQGTTSGSASASASTSDDEAASGKHSPRLFKGGSSSSGKVPVGTAPAYTQRVARRLG